MLQQLGLFTAEGPPRFDTSTGMPNPSKEDRAITTRLVAAGKLLGIQVLDHIVVGNDCDFSFADEGLLEGGTHA